MSTNPRNGFPDPPFWLACKSALISGSTQAIILHLNTRDYALPGKFLVPFLTGRLATRDIVAIYNRSSGIRFPMPTMEQKAKDLLGLDKPTQAPANPAFAALAAVTGQQSAPAFDWPKAPAAALTLLEKLMLADARVTVILEYAETLLPAADLPMMSARRPQPARHAAPLGHRPDAERRRQLRLSPGAEPDRPAPRPARR